MLCGGGCGWGVLDVLFGLSVGLWHWLLCSVMSECWGCLALGVFLGVGVLSLVGRCSLGVADPGSLRRVSGAVLM